MKKSTTNRLKMKELEKRIAELCSELLVLQGKEKANVAAVAGLAPVVV